MYGFVSVLLDPAALRCGTYFRICRCRQDHVCNFARGNEWAMRKKRILEMTHIGVTVNTVYQNSHRSGPIQTYIKIGYGGKHWCRSTGNYQRIERKGTPPQWTTTERHWQQNKTHTVRIECGAGYMWRSDVRLSYRSTAAVAWNGFVAGRSPDRRYRSTAAPQHGTALTNVGSVAFTAAVKGWTRIDLFTAITYCYINRKATRWYRFRTPLNNNNKNQHQNDAEDTAN